MGDKYRKNSLRQEVEVLSRLNHKNIIKIYDSIDNNFKINLIMEYVRGKSLYQYIRKKPKMRLSE